MTRRVLLAAAGLLTVLCAAIAQQTGRPVLAAAAADLPRLPERLADTGLYAGGVVGEIDPRNRAFSPQYPLWTDGMTKRRWIHLPEGSSIDAHDDAEWTFPAGTKLWKEFGLAGHPVETRFLWNVDGRNWVYGSYVWNADGTNAVLAPDGGVADAAEVASGRRHSIPGRTDCAACHGSTTARPLGFTALQLSTDRDPGAIHGEAPAPGMITLRTLVEEGRLAGARDDLLARPPVIRTTDPETRSMLGYLSANCGTCHNGDGGITATAPVIRTRDLLEDGDRVAARLVGAPTRWQVPGVPEGESVLIDPASPERSALLARMRSRSPASQMPPLGTVVRDQEAVEAMTAWITTHAARQVTSASRGR